MENIKEILKKEGISLEDLSFEFMKRMQILKMEFSEDFEFPKEQWISLKNELPFDNINIPTLKKVLENLLVAKHLKRRDNDKLLYELLQNKPSYRFFPNSFYYSKN